MKQQDGRMPHCADCTIEQTICRYEDGKGPVSCPTLNLSDVIERSLTEYQQGGNLRFAANASIQEAECYVNGEKDNPHVRYAIKPRIQETVEFAHKMGYRRLGLAFCAGLRDEAKIVSDILKQQGFEVASVICKVGRTPKEFLGLTDGQKITPGEFEAMCSPVTQAKVLNSAGTEFNILLGLCVGHDSLMMRFSEALCTVLVVKDRVTGHNPLAAIQLHQSYYKKLNEEKFNQGGKVRVRVEGQE
ncbi:MAG: DUF1847 domain-containing protein [Syntrophobacteraceae bacterium]|nr:DUF1847 domain-containing protein [Syntrophobacteraceae bacterium]